MNQHMPHIPLAIVITPPSMPGGGPDSSLEQMQYVFHELHADGRHAICAVCGSQNRQPAQKARDGGASTQNDR